MSVYHSNKQWTTYRILDATVDNADLADPLNIGATGAAEGKGFILWGDTSAAKIEWDEANDQLVTSSATIRMGTDDHLEFRDAGVFIASESTGKLTISADGTGPDDIILSGTVAVVDNMRMETGKNFSIFQGAYIYLTVPSSGEYITSQASNKITIASDGAGRDDITLSGSVACTDTLIMGEGSLDKKLYFYDTGAYLTVANDGKLTVRSDGTTYDSIIMSTGTNGGVKVTGTLNVGLGKTEKLFFWDTDVYLRSDTDGKLKISADSAAYDAIWLNGKTSLGGEVYVGYGTLDTKLRFYDGGVYLTCSTDGKLSIAADAASAANAIVLSTPPTSGVTVQYDLTAGGDLAISGAAAFGGAITVGAQTISDSSGNLASANGVTQTYASTVTGITVVNGIVTAVSGS